MKTESPLKSYSWWIADLRAADTRLKVLRIGKWMLECEVTAEEARVAFELIDAQLKWPRSNKEKELIAKWAAKYKDLQKTS
jgi:hypothetical protein